MKNEKKPVSVRSLTITAMLAAVAAVLMFLDFSTPFIPAFVKMDFSELPGLIAAFGLGPVYGIVVCLIKNLLNLLIHGSTGVPVSDVGVVALEGDGRIAYVIHRYVTDIYVLSDSPAVGCALEAQTGVRAAEGAVAHHDALHPSGKVAADHESPVRAEYYIVTDEDVAAGAGGEAALAASALHADTVVTHVHAAVDDQDTLAVAYVDPVTVLGVPGAAHGDAVHHDVCAACRIDVETGGILDGDTA